MFRRRSVTFLANSFFGKYLSVEKMQSQSQQWLTSPPTNDAVYVVWQCQRCKVNHNKLEDFAVWIETKPDAVHMQLNDFVLCHQTLARTGFSCL